MYVRVVCVTAANKPGTLPSPPALAYHSLTIPPLIRLYSSVHVAEVHAYDESYPTGLPRASNQAQNLADVWLSTAPRL